MPGTSHGVNAVLGEVCFRCTNGNTYYNVSVVPDPNSNIGINYLFPFNDHTAGQVSGCPHFPCSGSYTKPGDHQTKTTWDNHLVCQVKPSSVMTPEHDFIGKPTTVFHKNLELTYQHSSGLPYRFHYPLVLTSEFFGFFWL
jgi:hypothetical protein